MNIHDYSDCAKCKEENKIKEDDASQSDRRNLP